MVLQMLYELLERQAEVIDASRVYVLGPSMGGVRCAALCLPASAARALFHAPFTRGLAAFAD